MKTLSVIPLILLTACASQSKRATVPMLRSVPGTIRTADTMESVRYGENIKAYPVGRYVDPNNRLVMYERHTVYRVETTAKWNLHPNPGVGVPRGPVAQILDPARKDSPVTAEVIAEVNRQKAVTQTVIEQSDRLQQTLNQLSGTLADNQQITGQNAQLKQELNVTVRRLNALEQSLREQQVKTASTPAKNTDVW